MATFSLLDEPWIPVWKADGTQEEVSLRDTLLQPALHRRIDAGHPLHTAALYRLHLALLHRALGGPAGAAEAADWYLNGFPAGRIEAYLGRYADRFDLFGPQPFMQVVGLDPAEVGENFRSHWTRLSTEEGSPNTTALFNVEARPGGNRSDALTPAQAARQLLAHQSFALGGLIKRFTTSARAAPVATAALFLAEGSDLQQTLALNLTPYTPSMQAKDVPVWEQPPLTVADIQRIYAGKEALARPAEGYASRFGWPSRSVLLLPEETPEGLQVQTIGFGAGVPLVGAGEGSGSNVDPMVTLRPSRDDKGEPYPYKLSRDRLLWRDLSALLPDPAATVTEDRKGKVKTKPGRAPEVLLHAKEVMELAHAQAQPSLSGRPSQDEAEDWDAPLPDARAKHPVIPVQVFGQLTDQGKAFAMRQESYTLPQTFIKDSDAFSNHVAQALDDAATVGDALRRSVFVLAQELLSKGGDRSPDRADVTKLADQISATATFWQSLDTPFRQYLLDIDSGPEQALRRWHAALRRSALRGWGVAEQAAGMNAAGLRAVQQSQGLLLRVLSTLLREGETSDPS
ncbi:MAG: type I-E CRISPR-associated protein Cse1/CasA [Deinococcus sp.]|nr:type I-E CRISPR-associated protein Cse1/CasA [Deinococcus sp.]